jgi:hypothetical protein
MTGEQNYKTYLEVYNELKAAYRELWDEEVRRSFPQYKEYSDDLPLTSQESRQGKNSFCDFRG